MNNIIVQDVCEVYIKDLVDTTKAYFFGLTTKNEVTQKIKQEMLRAGIGNGVVGVVQSEKELNFNVTTLFNNDDIIAIQAGKAMTNGTATVQKTEVLQCASGKVILSSAPAGSVTSILVFDSLGKPMTNTFSSADKSVTITGAVAGAWYTCVYPTSVTGSILSLDSKAFPTNYYVELHTIGFNPDTNAVACDIYWTFSKALPDGSLTQAYEAGKQNGQDISFTAQLPQGATEYGRYIVVPRA